MTTDALRPVRPRVLVLHMRDVPLIDATAIGTLERIAGDCRRRDCRLVMAALQRQPRTALHHFGFLKSNRVLLTSNRFVAVEKAKALLEKS